MMDWVSEPASDANVVCRIILSGVNGEAVVWVNVAGLKIGLGSATGGGGGVKMAGAAGAGG